MRLLLTTTLSLLLGGPDARITHSVPVDLNFKLYGKPSCQPESDPDGGAGIFTQTIRVSHRTALLPLSSAGCLVG